MDENDEAMPRASNREKILSKGLRVMHERGFAGTSVRDVVEAARVPQGSFTNHFASKEAFSLEVLDLYHTNDSKGLRESLGNDSLAPLERIRAYINYQKKQLSRNGPENGCLYGNFTAEASHHSNMIRQRLGKRRSGMGSTAKQYLGSFC